jgi:hypothetical protein
MWLFDKRLLSFTKGRGVHLLHLLSFGSVAEARQMERGTPQHMCVAQVLKQVSICRCHLETGTYKHFLEDSVRQQATFT